MVAVVTGAAGFIGRILVDELARCGPVVAIDRLPMRTVGRSHSNHRRPARPHAGGARGARRRRRRLPPGRLPRRARPASRRRATALSRQRAGDRGRAERGTARRPAGGHLVVVGVRRHDRGPAMHRDRPASPARRLRPQQTHGRAAVRGPSAVRRAGMRRTPFHRRRRGSAPRDGGVALDRRRSRRPAAAAVRQSAP